MSPQKILVWDLDWFSDSNRIIWVFSHYNKLVFYFNMTPKVFLGRYLGVVFSNYKPMPSNFHNLVQKIDSKINSWHNHFLSKAGKSVLIQSHLESSPAYLMATTQLPKKICSTIDNINRKFFWQSSTNSSGHYYIF